MSCRCPLLWPLIGWGAIGATLILAVVWTCWHLPFWFMAGSGMAGTPLPVYVLYTLGLTGVMTWLHTRTGGSIFAAILMHTMANFVSNVFPTHSAQAHDSRAYLFLALIYLATAALLLGSTARRAATLAAPAQGG